MSKKTLAFLIILAIIAAGLIYLKTRSSEPEAASDTATQSQSEMVSESQKIAAAIASGEAYTCTMTQGDNSMDYLVQSQKFRMAATTDGQLTYAIGDGEYLYSWGTNSGQGVKTKLPTEEEIAAMTKEAQEYEAQAPRFDTEEGYDAYAEQGYRVDCAPATLTGTDFIPPSDIQFLDTSEFMNSAPDNSNSSIDMDKLQEMAKEYESAMPSEN